MRRLISTLISSLPRLLDVSVFLLFIFFLFGIFGLQQYNGVMYNKCRLTEKPINATYWPKSKEYTRSCSQMKGVGYTCPDGLYCGNPLEYGISIEDDGVYQNEQLNYGIASFDDMFQAILAVFQIITKDNWSPIMFNIMDAHVKQLAILFCSSIILLGSFFLINLVLAVIIDAFMKIQSKEQQIEQERLQEEERIFLEKKKIREEEEKTQINLNQQSVSKSQNQEQIQDENQTKSQIIEVIKKEDDSSKIFMAQIDSVKVGDTFSLSISNMEDLKRPSFPSIKNIQLGKSIQSMRLSNAVQPKVIGSFQELVSQKNFEQSSIQESQQEDLKSSQFISKFEQSQRIQLFDHDQSNQDFIYNKDLFISNSQEPSNINEKRKYETDKEHKEDMTFVAQEIINSKSEEEQKQLPQILGQTQPLRNEILQNIDEDKKQKEEQERIKESKKILGSLFARGFMKQKPESPKQVVELKKEDKKENNENEKGQEESERISESKKLLGSLFAKGFMKQNKEENKENLEHAQVSGSGSSLAAKLFGGFAKPPSSDQNTQQSKENIVDVMRRRISAARKIEDESKRDQIQEELRQENKIMLMKMQQAFSQKVIEAKHSNFGMKNEKQIVEKMKGAITQKILNNKVDVEDNIDVALDVHRQMKEEHIRKQIFSKIFDHFKDVLIDKQALENLVEQNEQMIHQQKQEDRAQKSKVFRIFYGLIQNQYFNFFITSCILLNTLILGLDKYPIDRKEEFILEQFNLGFSLIFFIEMILKLIGLGIKQYFRDGFNIFDFIIVLIGFVDISLTFTPISSGGSAVSALRAFRLMRVFKLAKNWKEFQNILKTMQNTFQDMSTFSILLLLFIFTYTLLGMELFAYKAKFNKENEIDLSENGKYIDSNCNDFLHSFLSVFIVLTSDQWSVIFYKHYRAVGAVISSVYFLSLILVGNYILLMLFLAILVQNFDESSISEQFQKENLEKMSIKQETFKTQLKNFLRKILCCKQNVKEQLLKTEETQDIKTNRSLFIFNVDNFLRIKIKKMVDSTAFEFFIIGVIVISSIHIALYSPLNDPKGTKSKVLYYIDISLNSIFTFEILAKIIAFGFYFNGKDSYLKNEWNVVDFLIVLVSVISDLMPQVELNFFKILRLLRVLRPLRVISKNENLKLSIQALIMSIPNILNVILISGLFFIIFAIFGVNFLKGKFYTCDTSNMEGFSNFNEDILDDRFDCHNYGGDWLRLQNNFDNIFQSLVQVFALTQTFSWSITMYQAMSSGDINEIPKQNKAPFISLYFIVVIIIGTFFITNLFVGVVISTYNREREKLGNQFLLTEQQKKWLETKMMIIQAKPKLFMKVPPENWRLTFYKISMSHKFDVLILICIIINTIVLMISWYGQPDVVEKVTSILNNIFAGIFAVEAIIKIIGFGGRYFKDNWNIFDFIVVIGTGIGMLVSAFTDVSTGSSATVIRALRIARMFKMFRKQKSLRIIFETFLVTLPALANVGALLMLFIFLYTVLGVNLFGTIKFNGYIDNTTNFKSIASASLTLMIMSTGENFYEIMYSLSRQNTIDYQCIDSPTYEDYASNGEMTVGCGNMVISTLIFYSFVILIILIFLNLFIAIILQGYQDIQERSEKIFTQDQRDDFGDKWSFYDQDATGYIQIEDYPKFMLDLGNPLGWDLTFKDNEEKQLNYIKKVDLPTYNNQKQYAFTDVLENLAMLQVVKQEVMIAVQKRLTEKTSLKSIFKRESPSNQQKEVEDISLSFKNSLQSAEKLEGVTLVKNLQKKAHQLLEQQNIKKDSESINIENLKQKLSRSSIFGINSGSHSQEKLNEYIKQIDDDNKIPETPFESECSSSRRGSRRISSHQTENKKKVSYLGDKIQIENELNYEQVLSDELESELIDRIIEEEQKNMEYKSHWNSSRDLKNSIFDEQSVVDQLFEEEYAYLDKSQNTTNRNQQLFVTGGRD